MATRPSGVGQQRREAQHPPIDRHMVGLDPALGEEFLDVAVGQAEAQVLADRQHDHIRREAEPGEGRPCNGIGADPASSHDASLAARVCSQQMQQRPRVCLGAAAWSPKPERAASAEPASVPGWVAVGAVVEVAAGQAVGGQSDRC
jgi:hypothetical protein